MVDHLIAFATAHYLLVGAFVILLALLIAHEMSRGGRSLSTSELTALVTRMRPLSWTSARPRILPPAISWAR